MISQEQRLILTCCQQPSLLPSSVLPHTLPCLDSLANQVWPAPHSYSHLGCYSGVAYGDGRGDGGWEQRRVEPRQVPRLTSCGSQAGDQCLLKGVIFLFGLSQFRIGYGWASMAHIWNSTHLRKPLSTAQPSIHPLSALLVLILGRLQFASSSPPISLRLQFRLPPYSITDFFPTVKPYF